MNIHNILVVAGMFFIPLLVVLVPILLGQRYGILRSKKSENLQNASVGSVVGAAFGLLAFMLAFTFQIAASRYNERKELLLEELHSRRAGSGSRKGLNSTRYNESGFHYCNRRIIESFQVLLNTDYYH
jgi:hypothetical protein